MSFFLFLKLCKKIYCLRIKLFRTELKLSEFEMESKKLALSLSLSQNMIFVCVDITNHNPLAFEQIRKVNGLYI